MGQIIQFVSKSERERIRLIQEARAIYDSIFPSTIRPASSRAEPVRARTTGATSRDQDHCRALQSCLTGELP